MPENIWLLKDDPLRPGGLLTRQNFWRDIALGTGVGLRVDVGMMVIRGDLGYGLHAPYDTGVPGYFNIPFKEDVRVPPCHRLSVLIQTDARLFRMARFQAVPILFVQRYRP